MNNLFGVLAVAGTCLLLLGCGPAGDAGPSSPAGPAEQAPAGADAHGHAHPTEGPHGGHLVELGDEQYRAELLHDEATHTVTVYVLDAAGKQPVAVEGPGITLQIFQDGEFVKYGLEAVAGEDAASDASQFQIVDEELCDTLSHSEEIRGRLNLTIDGETLTGQIEHHAHEHGEHDHADDDNADHDHDEEAPGDHDHADHELGDHEPADHADHDADHVHP